VDRVIDVADRSSTSPRRSRAAAAPPSNGAAPKLKTPKRKPPVSSGPTRFVASLVPRAPLPVDFGDALKALQEAINLPVWMLIQNDHTKSNTLDYSILRRYFDARAELAACGRIALVVDSPGGLGDVAYQIARVLQRDDGFTVVIPRFAKSAATLLSLGATEAIMGEDAEIGPLDAQQWDPEREEAGSALNEVQALDQLHTVALEHLDRTMVTMVGGTRKRTEVLLPIAARFVTDMMRPMLEKIDAVHYAKQARILAVAEHYAVRLLIHAGVSQNEADRIADTLVNRYPEHGFVIDRQEVEDRQLLQLIDPPDEVKDAVRQVEHAIWKHPLTALGKLEEI
jgi:hypothetical protein